MATNTLNSLIDIGANLTHKTFRNCLNEVVERASRANVREIIVTGTNLNVSRDALRLVQRLNRDENPMKFYSTVGIHPHDATRSSSFNFRDQLNEILENQRRMKTKSIVAIGECGLDFDRNFSTPEDQRRVFLSQLELADQWNLPLFLHERAASNEMISILKDFSPRENFRGVVHCFTHSSADVLRQYLDLNLYIGITGWICDERRGKDLAKIVSQIPLDRLLIETDAPFLLPRNLPKPWPQHNEPCYLSAVVDKLSTCYGLSTDQIIEHSTQNARKLFQLNTLN